MSDSLSTISLKEIKSSKKLTLSQKAVLSEIHSLISRNKEFYAWNTYLQEKLGIGRSTVANALTFFYKNNILKSTCERNDGKTAKVTKRTIKISYKNLAPFLNATKNLQTPVKQPLHNPTSEKPVILTQEFEDIDFESNEKTIFNQWSDYMIAELDRNTGVINPVTRERNALRGILDDARRSINSLSKTEADNAISKTELIKDRRIETAIFYCLHQMIEDNKNGSYYGEDSDLSLKTVDKSDLNYTFLRNIYKPWSELLAFALSKETFTPWENLEDDLFNNFFYSTGVRLSDIEFIKENESVEDYTARMKRKGFYHNGDDWDFLKNDTEGEDSEQSVENYEFAIQGEVVEESPDEDFPFPTEEEIIKSGLNLERIATNLEKLGYITLGND